MSAVEKGRHGLQTCVHCHGPQTVEHRVSLQSEIQGSAVADILKEFVPDRADEFKSDSSLFICKRCVRALDQALKKKQEAEEAERFLKLLSPGTARKRQSTDRGGGKRSDEVQHPDTKKTKTTWNTERDFSTEVKEEQQTIEIKEEPTESHAQSNDSFVTRSGRKSTRKKLPDFETPTTNTKSDPKVRGKGKLKEVRESHIGGVKKSKTDLSRKNASVVNKSPNQGRGRPQKCFVSKSGSKVLENKTPNKTDCDNEVSVKKRGRPKCIKKDHSESTERSQTAISDGIDQSENPTEADITSLHQSSEKNVFENDLAASSNYKIGESKCFDVTENDHKIKNEESQAQCKDIISGKTTSSNRKLRGKRKLGVSFRWSSSTDKPKKEQSLKKRKISKKTTAESKMSVKETRVSEEPSRQTRKNSVVWTCKKCNNLGYLKNQVRNHIMSDHHIQQVTEVDKCIVKKYIKYVKRERTADSESGENAVQQYPKPEANENGCLDGFCMKKEKYLCGICETSCRNMSSVSRHVRKSHNKTNSEAADFIFKVNAVLEPDTEVWLSSEKEEDDSEDKGQDESDIDNTEESLDIEEFCPSENEEDKEKNVEVKKYKWACKLCGLSYATHKTARNHLLKHHVVTENQVKTDIICVEIPKEMDSKSSDVEENFLHSLDLSGSGNVTELQSRRGRLKKSLQKSWRCSLCPRTYYHKRDTIRHLKKNHGKTHEMAKGFVLYKEQEENLNERNSSQGNLMSKVDVYTVNLSDVDGDSFICVDKKGISEDGKVWECMKCGNRICTRKGVLRHLRFNHDIRGPWARYHIQYVGPSGCQDEDCRSNRDILCVLCGRDYTNQVQAATHVKDCHSDISATMETEVLLAKSEGSKLIVLNLSNEKSRMYYINSKGQIFEVTQEHFTRLQQHCKLGELEKKTFQFCNRQTSNIDIDMSELWEEEEAEEEAELASCDEKDPEELSVTHADIYFMKWKHYSHEDQGTKKGDEDQVICSTDLQVSWKCSKCDEGFPTETEGIEHVTQVHQIKGPWGKHFLLKNTDNVREEESEIPELDWLCVYCGCDFNSKTEACIHVQSVHHTLAKALQETVVIQKSGGCKAIVLTLKNQAPVRFLIDSRGIIKEMEFADNFLDSQQKFSFQCHPGDKTTEDGDKFCLDQTDSTSINEVHLSNSNQQANQNPTPGQSSSIRKMDPVKGLQKSEQPQQNLTSKETDIGDSGQKRVTWVKSETVKRGKGAGNTVYKCLSLPTQKRTYNCKMCSAVISSVKHFSYHSQHHRHAVKWKCRECGEAFSSIIHLVEHISNAHKFTSNDIVPVMQEILAMDHNADLMEIPVGNVEEIETGSCSGKGGVNENISSDGVLGKNNQSTEETNQIRDSVKVLNESKGNTEREEIFAEKCVQTEDDNNVEELELLIEIATSAAKSEVSKELSTENIDTVIESDKEESISSGNQSTMVTVTGEQSNETDGEEDTRSDMNDKLGDPGSEGDRETDNFEFECADATKKAQQTLLHKIPCEVCGLYVSSDMLLKHRTLYHGIKEYRCVECEQVHITLESLNEHIRESHNGNFLADQRIHTCIICNTTFRCRQDLVSHLERHKSENCKCNICCVTFRTMNKLKTHMTSHCCQPSDKHECLICGKGVNSCRNFKRHLRSHFDEHFGEYRCELCKKSYKTRARFAAHLKSHGEEDMLCPYCAKTYTSKANFQRHLKLHENPDCYKCKFCDLRFETPTGLRRHIVFHHTESKGKTICHICGKKLRQIKWHMKTIHGENRKNLKARPMKDRQCPFCGKLFKRPFMMERHKVIHTGDKPYECTFCGKTFGFATTYKTHIRTHPEYKPWNCDLCGESFLYEKDWMSHRIECRADVVDTKFPYQCNICKRIFRTKRSLNMHQDKNHESRKLPESQEHRHFCTVCQQGYIYRSSLAQHMAREHSSELEKSSKPAEQEDVSQGVAQDVAQDHGPELDVEEMAVAALMYKCQLCQKEFDVLEQLNEHQEKDHSVINLEMISEDGNDRNIITLEQEQAIELLNQFQIQIGEEYVIVSSQE